jgi:hypothetical protein
VGTTSPRRRRHRVRVVTTTLSGSVARGAGNGGATRAGPRRGSRRLPGRRDRSRDRRPRAPPALRQDGCERLGAATDRCRRGVRRHDERRDGELAELVVLRSLFPAQLRQERGPVPGEDVAPRLRELFPRAEDVPDHHFTDGIGIGSFRGHAHGPEPAVVLRREAHRPRLEERDREDGIRLAEREIECNGAPVAATDQDRGRRVERTQERKGIVGVLPHARRRVRTGSLAAVAASAVVDHRASDRAEPPCGVLPEDCGAARAVDAEDRSTGAVLFVVQPHAVHRQMWHRTRT